MFKAQHTNKKNTLGLFLTLCFLGLFNALSAQIVITEISPTGEIELKNLGTANVNISTYWLCNFPAYDLISDLTFTCGSAIIEPGKVAVVKGQSVTVPLADGEMGLYTNSSFGNAAGLIDYVEWGKSGHRRASLAIANGIWPANTFLPALTAGQSFQATGDANAAADWKTAAPTLCDLVAAPNVLLATNAKLGSILTDSLGKTLYYFTRDAKKDTSFCTGGCAVTWPIFYSAKVSAATGLAAADFGTITRPDGKKQTTYKGWPLYYYISDVAAGDTKGEGVGTNWFVAKPDYAIMFIDNNLKGLDGVTYTSKYVPGTERVRYLVDAYGRTLYFFSRDSLLKNKFTAPDFSNNAAWPVYTEALGRIPSTLKDSLFKSIDVFGRKQLTYNGWPLYYFGRDSLIRGLTRGVSSPVPGRWPVAVPGAAAAPSPANIRLVKDAKLGSILVDSLGRTLYYYTRDAKKDSSYCATAGCLAAWPIFYSGKINLGAGLAPTDFGSFTRPDGKKQTTYKGWPLYYYVSDVAAGDTKGEGVGSIWYVAKPDYTVMLMDNNLKGLDGVSYTSKYVPGTERVKYFVDAYGRTLYFFSRDSLLKNKYTAADFSNNAAWPVFQDSLVKVPTLVSDTLFKTINVFGRKQLTYKGWPLYYFGRDSMIRGNNRGVSVPVAGRWPVATPTVGIAPTTAIQEAFRNKLSLRLSPVPTQDVLQVELSSEINGDASGTLYNLNGQAVKQFNFRLYQGQNLTRLDLSTLSTGLYLLSLKIDGQPAAYEKIIKQ